MGDITNNHSFHTKLPGVPDCSDRSDQTAYHLTQNYTLPISHATDRVEYLPPLVCARNVETYTYNLNNTCATLFTGAPVMLQPVTQCLVMLMRFSHGVPHFTSLLFLYIRCCTIPLYVYKWDFDTFCNRVFASDTSLAVAFALPLSYFTWLKYSVQCSHSLVLCHHSSPFCVCPSSFCDAYSSSSPSALLPLSPTSKST